MRLLLFLFFMLLASSLSAQKYDWDDFVEEYTSDVERAEEEDLQLHLQERNSRNIRLTSIRQL